MHESCVGCLKNWNGGHADTWTFELTKKEKLGFDDVIDTKNSNFPLKARENSSKSSSRYFNFPFSEMWAEFMRIIVSHKLLGSSLISG